MKHISYVIHPYTAQKDLGAGHDRYAYELLERTRKLGFEQSVFESGHLTKPLEAALAEIKMVGRLLTANKSHVYHATATMNAMAPITAGCPKLITTIHDVLWFFVKDLYDSKLKYTVKTQAIKRAARRSAGIIVPFQSTYDFLRDELNVPDDKLFLVPYGVDHDTFFYKEGETTPAPACFPDLDPDEKSILFVGAVNRGKGIDTLIRAMEHVCQRQPNTTLVVGSSGWDLPLIKDIWEQSPVKNKIKFIGFVPEDDLRAAYTAADVTCFPSRYGFGLPTLESMACGTPTVSGRTLDAPEFIEDAGLMCNPEDPEDIASALLAILQDEERSKTLHKKGLEQSANYSWQKTAEKTINVYQEFLG